MADPDTPLRAEVGLGGPATVVFGCRGPDGKLSEPGKDAETASTVSFSCAPSGRDGLPSPISVFAPGNDGRFGKIGEALTGRAVCDDPGMSPVTKSRQLKGAQGNVTAVYCGPGA